MARFQSTHRNISSRRSNAKQHDDFLDIETQRQAKRLSRQQKRLEKEAGVVNVIDIVPGARQKVVKFQDIKVIDPLTDTQRDFFEAWETNQADAYVLYGSAGTGKTFLALYHAIVAVMDPQQTNFHKLIIVRSSVQSRDQGFLPGTSEEKMEAFEAPYASIFAELTGKKDAYEKLKDMGKVEFMSTSFLRGSTFNNCIVVVDEFQSMNWHELKTICTRLGCDSKFIFCGDGVQSDLIINKNDVTGFNEFMDVTRRMPEFRNFRFSSDDIVRSGFVKSWIMTCEKLGL